MSVQNFIPTVWSEALQNALNENYIGVANCSREYEGEIREKGSRVKILNVGDIYVSDYTTNSDMSNPQTLDGSAVELVIDRAKYFNFQLDDVDRAQAVPTLMAGAMKKAADALAKEADEYIYSLYDQASFTTRGRLDHNSNTLLNAFLNARTKILENSSASVDDIIFEISPKVAEQLLLANIDLGISSSEEVQNGCIGKIGGCNVYVSKNIQFTEGAADYYHKCFARTKRAIAFAEQLSEIEAYRPERRFADAVKGLHLYGAKVVCPEEFGIVEVSVEG